MAPAEDFCSGAHLLYGHSVSGCRETLIWRVGRKFGGQGVAAKPPLGDARWQVGTNVAIRHHHIFDHGRSIKIAKFLESKIASILAETAAIEVIVKI